VADSVGRLLSWNYRLVGPEEGFLAEGAKIVVADIDGEGAARAAAEVVEGGGEAIAVTVDVADVDQTEAMAKATPSTQARRNPLANRRASVCIRFLSSPLRAWRSSVAPRPHDS